MRRSAILAVLLAVLIGCGEQNAQPEKVYVLKGTIVGRDAHDNTLRVDHQAIPGFMDAMTMDYSVHGAKVVQLPPNSTRIEARLHVSDDGYWLTDVKKAP